MTIEIKGMQYRLSSSTRRLIAMQMLPLRVRLVREPENEHDENAIAVFGYEGSFKRMHLGYVGRETAAVLAPKIDDGELVFVEARLVECDSREATGEMKVTWKRLK
jgi:hypothetical protein